MAGPDGVAPSPAPTGWTRGAVWVLVGVGLVIAAVVGPFKAADPEHSITDTVVGGVSGLLFLGAGAVAYLRRPRNRTGLLMILVALGWFAEDIRFVPLPVTYTAGLMLSTASSGVVAHLVLAFPEGRLTTRPQRWLVGLAYGVAYGLVPLGALFVDPRRYGQTYPPNLVLVSTSPTLLAIMGRTATVAGSLVAAGVVVVLVRRWITASAPRRRVLAPVLLTGLIGGLASSAGNALGDTPLTMLVLRPLYVAAFCLLPLAFLAGVLRVRLSRTAVTDLLVDLQQPLDPDALRDRLATALGDPGLRIGYWRGDARHLVDASGVRIEVPSAGSGQIVTYVDRGGARVAGLIHDAALVEDGHVLRAVVAAAGLTLDNQRLTAEVRAQLAEVRASRARIVTAVTEERRRMERDLHDGVQQSLVAAAIGLRVVEQRLGRDGDVDDGGPDTRALLRLSGDGIETALADLRALARGIHPAVLTEDGLVAALRALVDRAPVPVELTAEATPRLPAPIEATAYLVVAEALTNAMKHAGAARIEISVAPADGGVRVEVSDDGCGGADPGGSGLLGLADRVQALDGELVVRSGPGLGTTVVARLPRGGW